MAKIELEVGRVHECAGRASHIFALILATYLKGPILWISSTNTIAKINPTGIQNFLDPGRFVFVNTINQKESLWSMEESLRSGSVPLVVSELQSYPSFTSVRRLNLAAEAGTDSSKSCIVGLILTPNQGGCQGVETRWLIQPKAKENRPSWILSRTRGRSLPPANWEITQASKNIFNAKIIKNLAPPKSRKDKIPVKSIKK